MLDPQEALSTIKCAMTSVFDTPLLFQECRNGLDDLNQLAEEFGKFNEASLAFLASAFKIEGAERAADRSCGLRFKLDPQTWRERAEQTRAFAECLLEPQAKRRLLEIAKSYDQVAE
jgi:hypothetical protein